MCGYDRTSPFSLLARLYPSISVSLNERKIKPSFGFRVLQKMRAACSYSRFDRAIMFAASESATQ